MSIITYIGMDVHSTNYTLCAFTMEGKKTFAETVIKPDVKELVKYLETLNQQQGGTAQFECGYEAGCLGYTLYNELTAKGYKCVILAPTTMAAPVKELKTDKRDARKIAKCLAYGTYSPVYVPTEQDRAIKEYIRMRDDAQLMLKQAKQQINAFCLRHGKFYDGASRWTPKHLKWLRGLQFGSSVVQEAFSEYLITYDQLADKLTRFDKRIEAFAQQKEYAEKVNKLVCFKGIRVHTAMSLIVETSDFQRFPSARQYASFLGLVPGERSSGEHNHRLGITKAGNAHLRRLLIESANSYSHARLGRKCADLKQRQAGNRPEVIAYADKANDRLRRKYVRISNRSKSNVAKAAVARELACFIWGMMNDKLS